MHVDCSSHGADKYGVGRKVFWDVTPCGMVKDTKISKELAAITFRVCQMVALPDGTGRGQRETARYDRMHWPKFTRLCPLVLMVEVV